MEWARSAGVASGCIGLFIIFSTLSPSFRDPSNLLEIMLQSSINAVIAVA
jgi:ribose transport system permease protein